MDALPTTTALESEPVAPVTIAAREIFAEKIVIESVFRGRSDIRIFNRVAAVDESRDLVQIEDAPRHLKALTMTVEPETLADEITVIDPFTGEPVTVNKGVIYRAIAGLGHQVTQAAIAAQAVTIAPIETVPEETE